MTFCLRLNIINEQRKQVQAIADYLGDRSQAQSQFEQCIQQLSSDRIKMEEIFCRINQIYGVFEYSKVSVILTFGVECLDAYKAEDVFD